MLSKIAVAAIAVTMTTTVVANPNPHDAYENISFYASYIAEFGKEYRTTEEFRYRMDLFA